MNAGQSETDRRTALTCPACAAKLRVRGDPEGKKIACPRCGARWQVGAAGATAFVLHGSAVSIDPPSAEPRPVSEPSRTEPARTEPARTEPARTEPARTEPARAEPTRPEPDSPTLSTATPALRSSGEMRAPARPASSARPGGRTAAAEDGPRPAGPVTAGNPAEWLGRKLGQFQITRFLGKGGMGAVFEAVDALLHRTVALKVLSAAAADDPDALARFLNEARAAARVQHPNLVGLYGVQQDAGVTFIAMQLVRGKTAAEHVREHGPMGVEQAGRVVAQAAHGLAAAHAAGILHRDVKPGNLMISEDGRVLVADFGLAKSADSSAVGLTKTGEVVGTPAYMSPEQCRGERVDRRSDLYSLGATYFFLLTGRAPYVAENHTGVLFKHVFEPVPDPRELRPDLPHGCRRIIARAMAKDPAERYQSLEEFAEDLGRADSPLAGAPAPTDLAAVAAALPSPISRQRSGSGMIRLEPPVSAARRVRPEAAASPVRIALGVLLTLPIAVFAAWRLAPVLFPEIDSGPPADVGKAPLRPFKSGEILLLFHAGAAGPDLKLRDSWRVRDLEALVCEPDPGGSAWLEVPAGAADFRMEFQVRWESRQPGGRDLLEFQYRARPDEESYFALAYQPTEPKLLYSIGREMKYIKLNHAPPAGQWESVALEVRGTRHVVKINGVTLLTSDKEFPDVRPGRFLVRVAGGRVAIRDWRITFAADR
jgi:serine/threonine protein kinase